jgi:hypothetical protein
MMVKISEDYYSLEKYEISDNHYFDVWRADLSFDN